MTNTALRRFGFGCFGLVVVCLLTACTSIQVKNVDRALNVQNVCIEDNPKVLVTDFVIVVRNGFQRHGIATEVYKGPRPEHCEFMLTYTALRSWDISAYLSHAELRLYKGMQLVAEAEYHLRGKGGFAFTKFEGTRKKMTPVIDRLLVDY